MPTPSAAAVKLVRVYNPILVYWHCDCYWPLAEGPVCPMDHDTPIYDYRIRKGRKRRVWVCEEHEGGIAFTSRKAFLAHTPELCHAD